MKTLLLEIKKRLRRTAASIALAVHNSYCGRGASIRECGFAFPGDCEFCERMLQIIAPMTITVE